MNFYIQPKPFTDIDMLTFNIVRLSGRVVEMPLTLEENFPFKLYIEFFDETGRVRSQKNADREDLQKLIIPALLESDKALTPELATARANTQINTLIAGLLVGSKLERYQAAQALADNYQFTLLPVEQQHPPVSDSFPAEL